MATMTEQRYAAATAYIQRAIDAARPSMINPARYIDGGDPTTATRIDLAALQARWRRAPDDLERAAIARDAEHVADIAEETLPGAPQDRVRTNLYEGERPRPTPPLSYAHELWQQAADDWRWLRSQAAEASEQTHEAVNLVLIGGGLLLAIKALDAVAPRRDATANAAALNRQLEAVADESDHGDDDIDGDDDDDDDDDDDSDDDDNDNDNESLADLEVS